MKQWTPRNYYILRNKTSGKMYVGQTKRDLSKYKGSGPKWVNHCKKHGGYTKENIETVWSDWFEDEELARLFLDEFEDLYPGYYLDENTQWANQTPENTLEQPVATIETVMKTAKTKHEKGLYPEIGRKISKSLTGVKQPKVSAARKNKVSCYDSEGNYHYVTKEEYDSRDDLVGINKGYKMPERDESYRQGVSDRNSGRRWMYLPETNEKVFVHIDEMVTYFEKGFVEGGGKHVKQRQQRVCEYCGKVSDGSNYHRWHGSNCKMLKV
jgi:hypothetical protein